MDEVFRILESDFAELISPVIFAFPFGGGIGKELQTSSFFVTGSFGMVAAGGLFFRSGMEGEKFFE